MADSSSSSAQIISENDALKGGHTPVQLWMDKIRAAKKAEEDWRKDADAHEKAAKIRVAREVTLNQLALLNEKMAKMATMHDELAERIGKYDNWLLQWTEDRAPVGAS